MNNIKVGFGFYHHMLNSGTMQFARQCGATHAVVHLVDYHSASGRESRNDNQPVGDGGGWGAAGVTAHEWTLENLLRIKRELASHGLEFFAIENFDPVFWHDVLLNGPKRDEQIEGLKNIIRLAGKVGVSVIGYNFSLAGVAGRISGEFARGGAVSVGMEGTDDRAVPNGMVWNMVYDANAQPGGHPAVSEDELWKRLEYFLHAALPVAEENGVRLAAHPDDPPVSRLRQQPRLVYQPGMYQRLLDIRRSPANGLEFCIGTIAEMTEGNVYEATDRYTSQGNVAYIHLRNVRGKAPSYREVFIDEGDVDFTKIVRILKRNRFDGVMIPDHTPQMNCDAPWHAGMAYAIGYMNALLQAID